MTVLKSIHALLTYFADNEGPSSCLADTGFLYALAYEDDRLHKKATEISDLLAERQIAIYTNVVARMEFVDLIFRKQVAQGAINLFEAIDSQRCPKNLLNLLKNIRDKDTASQREKQSYKIEEFRLKKLRKLIEEAYGLSHWRIFCKNYIERILLNDWQVFEEELGLNFVEVLENEISDLIHSPLRWQDMVQLMAEHGLRGPDAMIANLFDKSLFPLLITTDGDFENCFTDPFRNDSDKAVLLL